MNTRVKSIEFIEDKHEYWFTDEQGRHRRLFGVTTAIGKMLGKHFPDNDTVMLATLYGKDVHKEVENYYNKDIPVSSEGAKWVLEELDRYIQTCMLDPVKKIECEVMVSDFEGTASKVDVVAHHESGKVTLFDIKTTAKFDREYCSLQLSVYKVLYEQCYDEEVMNMFVLGTKSKRSFRIFYQQGSKVNKVLCTNREKTI